MSPEKEKIFLLRYFINSFLYVLASNGTAAAHGLCFPPKREEGIISSGKCLSTLSGNDAAQVEDCTLQPSCFI